MVVDDLNHTIDLRVTVKSFLSLARVRANKDYPRVRIRDGPLAHLVERLLCKQEARSSSLLGPPFAPHMLGSILIGLFLVAGGVIAGWQQRWIVDNIGHVSWAEEKLGSTYTLVTI